MLIGNHRVRQIIQRQTPRNSDCAMTPRNRTLDQPRFRRRERCGPSPGSLEIGRRPSRADRKVDDSEYMATANGMKANGHTVKDIAKYLGVSRATLYRYLTEDTAPAVGVDAINTSRCFRRSHHVDSRRFPWSNSRVFAGQSDFGVRFDSRQLHQRQARATSPRPVLLSVVPGSQSAVSASQAQARKWQCQLRSELCCCVAEVRPAALGGLGRAVQVRPIAVR